MPASSGEAELSCLAEWGLGRRWRREAKGPVIRGLGPGAEVPKEMGEWRKTASRLPSVCASLRLRNHSTQAREGGTHHCPAEFVFRGGCKESLQTGCGFKLHVISLSLEVKSKIWGLAGCTSAGSRGVNFLSLVLLLGTDWIRLVTRLLSPCGLFPSCAFLLCVSPVRSLSLDSRLA